MAYIIPLEKNQDNYSVAKEDVDYVPSNVEKKETISLDQNELHWLRNKENLIYTLKIFEISS